MKMLIIGASSYVGAGIYTYFREKWPVVGTYFSNALFPELLKMDITDEHSVQGVIEKAKPSLIILVAANADARWCEKNQQEAVSINENGVQHIVDAANAVEAKVIYISSVVALAPTSVYAKTKIEAEKTVKKTKAGWVILRPSLIIGYSPNTINDRPFNRILKNLTEQSPAKYDGVWKFQPTWLEHIAEVIEGITNQSIDHEIIPVVIPVLKTRFDLANDILSRFNIKVEALDTKDPSPVYEQSLDKLVQLGLPTHSYEEMIEGIVSAIRKNVVA